MFTDPAEDHPLFHEHDGVLRTAVKHLNEFTSAQGVALYMHLMNVKGARKDSHHCPVARYLKNELRRRCEQENVIGTLFVDYGVNRGGVNYVFGVKYYIYNARRHYALSEPVRKFLNAFDDGAYPELVGIWWV